MKYLFKSGKQLLIGGLIFSTIFAIASFWIIQREQKQDIAQFNIHAEIIANDLWAMSQLGVRSYLQLAVQANNYKNLTVLQEDNTPFIEIASSSLSGLDRLLCSLGLIPLHILSAEITHHGQHIGLLTAEHYRMVVYHLADLFVFLLLFSLIALFIHNLFSSRRLLEQEVLERTQKHRESEQRFHDLVNLLPEMVYEVDMQGQLTYANKLFLQRFEISEAELSDFVIFDSIIPEQRERAQQCFSAVITGQQTQDDFTAVSSNGTTFPVLVNAAPVYDGEDICGGRAVVIDMTERNALEQQLRKAQKTEVIGLMAGGVAHDLNNILSGVINYPELILMKLPADSDLRNHVNAIKAAGLRAADVVDDLLTVARGVSASKTVTSPNKIIREYLESPEFFKQHTLYPTVSVKTELQPTIPNIACSSTHVMKSIMNLIVNALEAVDGRGEVTVSTEFYQLDKLDRSKNAIKSSNYVVIAIKDSGSGISALDQEQIFEPFYSKKEMGKSGTGLGLTVVWNTMQDHNGWVDVSSNENGTTFSLYFPTTDQLTPLISPDVDLDSIRGNGEKILVIDDDSQQQDIAIDILTSLNYKVTVVSSGKEAVEFLRTRVVHLLLLDMIMPPGINGLETYKQILAIHPKQKAVIVSGFAEDGDVKKVLSLGAERFIKKPYALDELGQTVYSVFH